MSDSEAGSAVEEQTLAGIPVWARPGIGDPSQRPVVIVLHGMSTTPAMMQAGWPPGQDDGFDRVYWQLPVLREGKAALAARREQDLFFSLFAAVWEETRAELPRLLAALGDRPVGLFGFSIGGFLALWGALDHPQVRAAVSVGGVPNFDYLGFYYPDYPWGASPAAALRDRSNLLARVEALAETPTLILQGRADEVARWEWMRPLAEALAERGADRHPHQVMDHLRHRLLPESPEESQDVDRVRAAATAWFQRWLT